MRQSLRMPCGDVVDGFGETINEAIADVQDSARKHLKVCDDCAKAEKAEQLTDAVGDTTNSS